MRFDTQKQIVERSKPIELLLLLKILYDPHIGIHQELVFWILLQKPDIKTFQRGILIERILLIEKDR